MRDAMEQKYLNVQKFVIKQRSKGQRSLKNTPIETMWKSFGNTALFAAMSEGGVAVTSALERKYPHVRFILDALAICQVVFTTEGDQLL